MTVIDALVGAVVGGVLTASIWAGRYLLIERRKAIRLEQMLHTELSHMDILDNLDGLSGNKFPDPSAFPTFVFENKVGDVGLLDQEIRHSIHAFYSYLRVTNAMMEQEIDREEDDPETRKLIRDNLESLRARRQALLDRLES